MRNQIEKISWDLPQDVKFVLDFKIGHYDNPDMKSKVENKKMHY